VCDSKEDPKEKELKEKAHDRIEYMSKEKLRDIIKHCIRKPNLNREYLVKTIRKTYDYTDSDS